MNRFSLTLTQLIHENLSTVMMYAYSRASLMELRRTKLPGNWKYLDKVFFEVSTQRADRACIELATFIRLLDDDESLAEYWRQVVGFDFGRVVKDDAQDEPLYLRDLTNKILHAAQLGWDFSTPDDPKLICVSRDPDRWKYAEIKIVALAAFCGNLMS